MITSLLLLSLSTVHAATVAVLPFDGYGATYADTETVTQGIRDAFLAEQGLNPLTDTDIADGLTGSGDLADARARIADARRAYQARRAEEALALVDEGLDLHYQALSDVARRPEMADAWYLKALCLYALERDDEAADAFMETAFLFPKYLKDRATALPTGAISIAAGAQAAMETGRKRVRTSDSVREIGAALDVEYVVIGWVTGEGDVVTRIYDEGTFVAEERAQLAELPALPVDDAYSALTRALARDLRGTATSTASRPSSRPDQAEAARIAAEEAERAAQMARRPADDARSRREEEERAAREEEERAAREEDERAAREEDERAAREEAAERAAASRAARERAAREEEERLAREEDDERAAREREEDERAAREREEDERAAREEEEDRERAKREAEAQAREEQEAKERAAKEREQERAAREREEERAQARAEREANPGACAADDAPITCKWWFWAATAGGAGGVTALLGYAAYEPPPTEVEGPPTWSVEIAN